MKTNIWRIYTLLLPWTTLIQKCVCQKVLLTMIGDQCITNTSSAMAWIYNPSDIDYSYKEVSEIRAVKKDNGRIEGLCDKRDCFSGKNWLYINSLEGYVNNLITDRRWEDFNTYITKNTDEQNKLLDYQLAASFSPFTENFMISFSVQVDKEAHIFLCSGKQVSKSHCYWFMLQGWGGEASGFRICQDYEIQSRYNGKAPLGYCKDSTMKLKHDTNFPHFISENHWNHFRIVKSGNDCSLQYPNGSVILTADISALKIEPSYLFFHTKASTGLWKVHNFEYFYTTAAGDVLQSAEFSVFQGQNCLSFFVVMCKVCVLDIQLVAVQRDWLYRKTEQVLQTTTINTQARLYISIIEIRSFIKPTIDWLLNQRFPSGNFPSSMGSGSGDRLVQWCHGAPGFVPLCTLQRPSHTTLTNNKEIADEKWADIKLSFYMMNNGQVHLKLIPKSSVTQNNFWAFNYLKSCDVEEIRVLKPANPLKAPGRCQLLEKEMVLTKKKKPSSLENWKKCKETEFGENCLPCKLIFNGEACPRKTKYCQLLSTEFNIENKCFCSIGNKGQNCQDKCDGINYGHGCQGYCKNCQDTCGKDPINGKCDSKYCINNFVGETCEIPNGIFIFAESIEIKVGPTSCNLKVKSFIGKGNSKPAKFYKFQYKKVHENNWLDVTKKPLKFNNIENVTLSNLEMESLYSIRVFGFTKEEDLTILGLVSKEIEVLNFFTKCTDLNKDHVEIEPFSYDVKIYFSINGEDLEQICDLSKYNIKFNNKFIEERQNIFIISNLEPYKEYTVDVTKNGMFLFSKNFRTKESVPDEVKNFRFSKTDKPSELLLKWSKPTRANGELLFYNISVQLKKYLACQEITRDEEFIITLSASHVEWLVTGLKPYAEYNIEIHANTSAGFGRPVNQAVITNYFEFVEAEEIPQLSTPVPGTDTVVFQFIEAPCEKRSGPLYINTIIKGTESWCNDTIYKDAQELKKGDLIIEELKPFCKYDAKFYIYRINENTVEETETGFTTLESVPNEIRQLEVTSKGTTHISLRWLEPYPPTGNLEEYKICYCSIGYWRECSDSWSNFVKKPTHCKLWPDFHCLKISLNKYSAKHISTVQIQSKNKGNPKYSLPVKKAKIAADNKQKSQAPYGLNMSWTKENYLDVSWYHPNNTGGVLSSFRIYVNEVQHEYKISSEEEYSLIYNVTIKSDLTFPDNYTVKITACNLAGESDKGASINGESPPPIPEESVESTKASEGIIKIIFRSMKQYKVPFKRFLYVLVTRCGECLEEFDICKDSLLQHHEANSLITPIESFRQWKIRGFDMEKNEYQKKISIGNNTIDDIPYTIEQNTNYKVGFIWIYRFGSNVRINSTIISIDTGSTEIESLPLQIIIPLVAILVVTLTMIGVYARLKNKIHGLFGSTNMTDITESEYVNHLILTELPPKVNNRSSVILRNMPDTICPGNPLFITKNSKRIKLEHYLEYVKKSHESDEFSRQHQLFPKGATKSWSYGASPQNKAKNRYKDLIAYNHSRVVLNKIEGVEDSDYINASYIDGYQMPRAYIATQGPKSNTLIDFWRMIWQEKVSYIVALANVYEGGKKKMEQYWPNNDEKLILGDFTITFLSSEIHASYECRNFLLHYKYSKPRQIAQFHFKVWPDHGVPLYPQSLVPILQRMLALRSKDFPIVVHCSAGVGRTGTVILCDICLRMAAAEGCVDALATLEHLRNQRANMVDNTEQYRLVHLVILNCLKGLRTIIPVDENFARSVEKLFHNNIIASQVQYIRDCEWEDDAMKPREFMDDEEMPMIPEKNRFPEIVPDETTRVFLYPYPPSDPTPSSTYINAVQVDAFCDPGRFIVTQYPLPNTVGDFWRLVAEKDISVIVCLNDIPTKDKTCKLFFPVKLDEMNPEDTINIKHVSNKNFQMYTILTFQMTITNPYDQESKIKTIEIVKFRGWKILQQVPTDYMDFITFVEDTTHIARKSTPTLITCYDGATGSGLFIALSFLMEKIKLEQECDVCQAVRSIRTSRKQFTNNEAQLKFLYKAALLYVEEKFNQYSNITY